VRVKGNCDKFKDFEEISGVLADEKAFITPKMKEKDFASFTDGSDVVSKIRIYEA